MEREPPAVADAFADDRLRGQQGHPHSWRREQQYDEPDGSRDHAAGSVQHYRPAIELRSIGRCEKILPWRQSVERPTSTWHFSHWRNEQSNLSDALLRR